MIDLTWYQTLIQPPLTPPALLFAPAWVILYTMIFISFILFATKRTNTSKALGYVLFSAQLLLNIGWSPVFFSYHNITLALAIIILLDILVFFNIREFHDISKKSAYFLIPYFLWLLFATYLNAGIVILN